MIHNIFKLAWRNIWRNKRRTGLTLLAIIIGMISIIFGKSYISGILQSMAEPIIEMQIGHIRLINEEFLRMERVLPKDRLVQPLGIIEEVLRKTPGVQSMTRLIKFRILAAHGETNEGGIAIGVHPSEIAGTLKIDQVMKAGSMFTEDRPGLVIGSKLAKKLGAEVGDEILLVTTDLNYSTYALPFTITGIFEFGFSYLDKNVVYIPFAKAAEMMDYRDATQEILVYIADREQAPETAKAIQVGIAGVAGPEIRAIPWQESDIIKTSTPLLKKVWGSILYLMMGIAALVILNTMLMTVMERYREIGIIKAMGFKNRDVVILIYTEAFYIGLIGSLIGGVLGAALTGYTMKTGISLGYSFDSSMLDSVEIPLTYITKAFYPQLSLTIVIVSILFGIVASLAAVIYPAFKSTRMSPVEAFRSDLKV